MVPQLVLVAALVLASASAAPSAILPLAYTAPGVVTASSSQVVARNYNGLAPVAPVIPAAPVVPAAPVLPAAPYVAAPYVASPYVAPYASPLAYNAPYLW